MALGLKPTRLDGALDFVGLQYQICDKAETSCEANQLCGLRRFSPRHAYTVDQVAIQKLLVLGARDSPVCARIYDKGLEQRGYPEAYWERIEAEFKGDRAIAVAHALIGDPTAAHVALQAHVLGAFDFREANGRTESARRPRVAWWQRVHGDATAVRTAVARKDSSFEKWMGWFRKAVGPRLLEIAEATNLPVGQLLEFLLDGVDPGSRGGPVVTGALQAVPH